ncbi:MAG: virulence factor TspB C-terminal domain-related protein [Pseudomonadota bacterium]
MNTPASGASSATSSSSSGSSTTKCEGDKCTTTTTTTTTNPDGSKTDKTSTKEQPKSDFCTDNPRSAICKEGGTWGGSCGAFSCDGDAVTCAIAQASWRSACALDIEPTDSKVQAGNTALSGGDRPAGHPGNNPSSSLFTANLDQTNPYGSTCPGDIPLNVMGNVVSIPLSSACDTFRLMGQVAVAFTLLAAAFVIFGGVKG